MPKFFDKKYIITFFGLFSHSCSSHNLLQFSSKSGNDLNENLSYILFLTSSYTASQAQHPYHLSYGK